MTDPMQPPALPEPKRGDGLGAREASRIALAAQGLAGVRKSGRAGRERILRTVARLGLLQLDSVNVLTRAHYLPLLARLGSYERPELDALAAHDGTVPRRAGRRLFEYWAHEASLLPVELQPLLRWRMAEAEAGRGLWRGVAQIAAEEPQTVARVLASVRDRGALAISDLEEAGPRSGGWWGWSRGKIALEWLFWTGRLTTASRRGFERVYDLPERVLPQAVLDMPTPAPADAHRALMALASRAMGVATETDLRDYFRLPLAAARAALLRLLEEGALSPVTVEGWRQPAYIAADAEAPARTRGTALLVPFDPLIWCRPRTQRLFGVDYRIEIYTPAAKRKHGYYVLPFLWRGRIVARLDLKSDRQKGRLVVKAAHAEPKADRAAYLEPLAAELALLAGWLGLEAVAIEPRGDLAPTLADLPGFAAVEAEESPPELPAESESPPATADLDLEG